MPFKKKLFFIWFAGMQILQSQLNGLMVYPPEYIGTAMASVNDYPYKHTIARIGQPVFISFDDLEGDEKTYYYRIKRFDENWKPSSLVPSEYIDGFDSDMIQQAENSVATLYSYTHYTFQIPNPQTRIKLSGNYLIEILNEDDETVFNFPVVFYENVLPVSVKVQYPQQVDKLKTHQWVTFTVHTGNAGRIQNAYLKPVVLKNENLLEARRFELPTFDAGNKLEYRDPERGLFWGGNEFLSFQSRDLRGYNPGVDSIRGKEDYYFYLRPAYYFSQYSDYRDIDGSFIIDTKQGSEPGVEADYVQVVFRLHPDAVKTDEPLYVTGRFNHWHPDERHRLTYNKLTGFYETTLLLKQGHYDYFYVGKNPDGSINWKCVSPGFSQTENRYTVLIYYKEPGGRYTRVLGMGQAVSKPLR